MAKEDATGQAVEPSMEQLLDINRKQSEIISAQARTIEELRGTIVELNASLAWLKRKVFGKMSEKCKPVDNGDPKLPFDYGDLEQKSKMPGAGRLNRLPSPSPGPPIKRRAVTGSSWITFRL